MGNRKRLPKKEKLEIVFNEKSRQEFLTGFRKRKNERRKKAKVQLEEMVKAERKRIKQEVKDGIKNFKRSYAPLPLEDDIVNQQAQEYDEEEVTVKVVELTTKDIAEKKNFLGENRPDSSDDEDQGNCIDSENEEEVPGMSIVVKKKKIKKSADAEDENEIDLKTKKDLDKIKKDKILKSMKKSKIFKMKVRAEQLDNRKRFKQTKNKEIRQLKSQGRRVDKKPDFRKMNAIRGKSAHKKKHKKKR